MSEKKNIMLFFYRFMEFRLFFQTGLLKELADKNNVIVIVPEETIDSIRKCIDFDITIAYTNQGKMTVKDEFKGYGLSSHIQRLMAFVYAEHKGQIRNVTPKLHFKALRKQVEKASLKSRAFNEANIMLAKLTSRSLIFRRILQHVFAKVTYKPLLADLFQEHNPDLCVVGSFGVAADGLVMLEAKKRNVPVAVVLQTWDRTSSKGYPVVPPDYVLTWSHVTADEAHYFLDVAKERIFVDGAPLWDQFFNNPMPIPRDRFFEMFSLDPTKKLIYFAMNSLAYHDGNMKLMLELSEIVANGMDSEDVQMLIRLHPSYFSAHEEKEEMYRLAQKLEKMPGIHINKPDLISEVDGLLFTDEDQRIQAASFYHCDLTISCISTYMIESSIFDKPAINIEFGRWKTNLYDIDVSDYIVHHLKRIYDLEAIYRVKSMEELKTAISSILKNPNEKSAQRKQLVDQEIPVNRGNSVSFFAKRLTQIAQSHKA